jgi:predicted nucleotidyltransferase
LSRFPLRKQALCVVDDWKGRLEMVDVRSLFKAALEDTVKEWKKHESVDGIFVYGSYARGTATADSDLDIGIIWNSGEAPVRLMSTHKEVLIDMEFMAVEDVEAVLNHSTDDVIKVSEVVNRLRTSQVLHDPKGMLKKWQKEAMEYSWSSTIINKMKETALDLLARAKTYATKEDYASAIYEMREGLFQFGRAILMSNNILTILRPAEVLTEVRLLDPIAYQLFLRSYKLRGLDEPRLLIILQELHKWLEKMEKRLEDSEDIGTINQSTRLLAQAQRQYHGSLGLTYGGDYELAALEMREAACTLGKAMVTLHGKGDTGEAGFIASLRDIETEFFNQILVEHGAYDIQPTEINRIISEAQFLVHRI